MAMTTDGLTNGGGTANYKFQYDDSLAGPGGPEPARTNAVIANCDADFYELTNWFVGTSIASKLRIDVLIIPQGVKGACSGNGACWDGNQVTISDSNLNDVTKATPNLIRYLLVTEVAEMFMEAQDAGWWGKGTEGSNGEALSRIIGLQFLRSMGIDQVPLGYRLSNGWLASARADFVNNPDPKDNTAGPRNGCGLLFLCYLQDQLGFDLHQIIKNGASSLAGVYNNLTGDDGDPFPFFRSILDARFPKFGTITKGNFDDPFPFGLLSFWVDKSTFGVDEVNDAIATGGGKFPDAFWLVLEGFSHSVETTLLAPKLTGPFANLPGITIAPGAEGVLFEGSQATNSKVPQRIRYPFDVTFTKAALDGFPPTGTGPISLGLSAVIAESDSGKTMAAASTEFELVSGADPFFVNVNAVQANVSYLSQDLRVFTATPGIDPKPVKGGPAFGADTFKGAYKYIQDVLAFLNDPKNQFTDGTSDPFTSGVIPQQEGAFAGDSSVAPMTLVNPIVGAQPSSGIVAPGSGDLFNNYNFAIARVRMRGTPGPSGSAQNVRVFFRLWSTETADTAYEIESAYPSFWDGSKPRWPLPSPNLHTFPFFATNNHPNFSDPKDPELGVNGVNNRTLTITTGDQLWAYFGCFLNFYDPSNTIVTGNTNAPVQALLLGTHHCLVAQIAYDDAPIVLLGNGVPPNPENSDKLAQRNLQLTFSDNPGPEATHRVPQTFDLRPGVFAAPIAGEMLDYPDELMIDWGNTPSGSVMHVYWPQIPASKVLSLAARLYGTHRLSASDAHTIDCTADGGITYIPIPPGTTENLAGLFTVDLPTTVVAGQKFVVVVRRVATRRPEIVPNPMTQKDPDSSPSKEPQAPVKAPSPDVPVMVNWRYVTGTFQITIPVTTPDVMLPQEEMTLAVMKWRMKLMSASNRWHPVLERYIGYISDRVAGLGGDPDTIPASPTPVRVLQRAPRRPAASAVTGRVVRVLYDCTGSFEGFVLGECCDGERTFATRERGIGKVAMKACRFRMTVTVLVDGSGRICGLTLSS